MKTEGTREWTETDEGPGDNFNTTLGCSNLCRYCYSRWNSNRFHRKSGLDPYHLKWDDWGNMTFLKSPSFATSKKVDGLIMTPTSHDIMPFNLEVSKKYYLELLEAGNKLLIVTKPMPKVIIELANHLKDYSDQIIWRLSITSLDEKKVRFWEPGSSSIKKRLETLDWLYTNDFITSLSMEPFLDRTVVELVRQTSHLVREKIWIGPLNFTYVKKEFITDFERELYSPHSLLKIKRQIDHLSDVDNVVWKDTFIHIIENADRFRQTNLVELLGES